MQKKYVQQQAVWIPDCVSILCVSITVKVLEFSVGMCVQALLDTKIINRVNKNLLLERNSKTGILLLSRILVFVDTKSEHSCLLLLRVGAAEGANKHNFGSCIINRILN